MSSKNAISQALHVAYPVMVGYVGIGFPAGLLEGHIGMNVLMAFVMSVTFYSGAGQFMIPNMWLAGASPLSIILSVSFVNTRQMLYSAAFSPFFEKVGKLKTFLFAATVTDESFGVNLVKYQEGDWDAKRATLVNLLCMISWGLANALGALVGAALDIPTSIAAFAMTSIFICLLVTQKLVKENVLVASVAFAAVIALKLVGVTGAAILVGALCGVLAGLVYLGRARE